MTTGARDVLAFEDLGVSFDGGRTWAVRGVRLAVARGETLALLGSSGSGKTTLLRAVSRLIEPSEGRVLVDGEDALAGDPVLLRRRLGHVFQGAGLFPHLTVRENVGVGPRLLGWPRAREAERTAELLDLVGLPPARFAERFPDELSGGQRQRVALARALAHDPPCLLMDEPFAALDAVTRDDLQHEVARLVRRLCKTVLFVTHDLGEAAAIADRIAVLHAGRVEQVGSARDVLDRPASSFVRALVDRPRRRAAELLGGSVPAPAAQVPA